MALRQDIKELIQLNALRFDRTLDVSEGSPFYKQIVVPLLDALGPDPLTTPTRTFVEDRIRQEYPSLNIDEGSPFADMVTTPLALTLGALKEQILRANQRQSVRRPELLTEADGDDLMANWFVEREYGQYSTVVGRLFFTNPTFVNVSPVTQFSTTTGLNFFPTTPQAVTAGTMSAQRFGDLYYADFYLRAQSPGSAYEIESGQLTSVRDIPNVSRVTNPSRATPGSSKESNTQLVSRGRRALTERSTTNSRGIEARLNTVFPSINRVQVVGYNDPEMQRDVMTGGGQGAVKAAGKAFVFGTFVLFFSGWEDRGLLGTDKIAVGMDVILNYGKLLYGLPPASSKETFEIDSIVFDSRDVIPNLPNILLFRLDASPTPTSTILGALPGFLPAVNALITGAGKLTISDIPGGLQAPNTGAGELEILDGVVHIGGHHDVFVRPTRDTSSTLSISNISDGTPLVSRTTLTTSGSGATPNIVSSSDITLDWLELGVQAGMYLILKAGADAGVYRILEVAALTLVLDVELLADEVGLPFSIVADIEIDPVQPKVLKLPFGGVGGDDLATVIGSAVLLLATNTLAYGVAEGDIVKILDGDDAGDYVIVGFDTLGGGATPIIDRVMTDSASGLTYEIFTSQSGIQLPLVRIPPQGMTLLDSNGQPSDIQVPYALPVEGRTNQAFTGASTTACGTLGFTVPSLGLAFENMGAACPTDLSDFLSLNPAAPDFEVIAASMLARSNYYTSECLDCDGYIFCVTIHPDEISVNWSIGAAGEAYVTEITTWLTQTIAAFFPSFVASAPPIFLAEDGKMVINWNMTLFTGDFLTDGKTPFLQFEICIPKELIGCCSNLFMAVPDIDLVKLFRALSDWFKLIKTGTPDTLDSAEAKAIIADILNMLPRNGPALCSSRVGDTLVLTEGPNAGGYDIASVYELSLETTPLGSGVGLALLSGAAEGQDVFGLINLLIAMAGDATSMDLSVLVEEFAKGDLVHASEAEQLSFIQKTLALDTGLDVFRSVLKLCAVGIRGQFPVDPWKPFCDLFAFGFPLVPPLPEAPEFDVCYDSYGDPKDPFDVLVEFFKWILEALESMGLDINETFDLTASELFAGLLNGSSVDYCVGPSTCAGTMRLYFTEPTSVEVDSGGRCVVFYDPTTSPATPVVLAAAQPTLFTSTVGSLEILFGADPDADPYPVIPSQDTVTEIEPQAYPRDLSVGTPVVSGSNTFTPLTLTGGDRDAPIIEGIQQYRDEIEIHEEIFLLPRLVPSIPDTNRIPAFTTRFGSNVLTLAMYAQLTAVDLQDLLEIGDILFIEGGADKGGYVVTKILNRYQVEVDRPMTETSTSFTNSGLAGSYSGIGPNPSRFYVGPGEVVQSTSVGKYLTVFMSSYPESNGSYEITSVDPLGAWAELSIPSGSFTVNDVNVPWAVTLAPLVAPPATDVGGTELVAARAARVYNGTATVFTVVDVGSSLTAGTSFSVWSSTAPTVSPVAGTSQPFRIVRPGVQRISSTRMERNTDGSLYYFDVWVRALGTDEVHNVPADQRFEAVFGTYSADGYYYEVEDTNFTFSTLEKVKLMLSPSFLPVGREDRLAQKVPLHGQSLQILYDHSPLVNQVHQFLISPKERTICANPVGRHFLPTYISVEIRYVGGNSPSVIGAAIQDAIERLLPTDALSLASQIENILSSNGATDWTHDITLVSVTHDLNRRLVGNRSRDRLGGSEPFYFNGSNRISFFIPGTVEASDVSSSQSGPGEKIAITQETSAIQFR